MNRSQENPRIEIVDALRGLAALAVTWFHLTQGGGLLPEGWLKASGAYGWLGVEVFFVISGFVIPFSMSAARYRLAQDGPRFLARRLIRLEPPYLCSVALCIALYWLSVRMPGFHGAPLQFSAGQVFSHVGYLTGVLGYDWVNVVYWSLALEFQYYLAVALLFPLLDHRNAWVRGPCFAALCLAPFAAPNPLWVPHWLGLFAIGMSAWRYRLGGTRVEFAVLLAASGLSTWFIMGHAETMAAVAAALLIAFARLPRIAPLALLGLISYSLYLLHVPIGGRVINLAGRLHPGMLRDVAALAVALGASLAAAALWYRLLEKPSHALARRVSYGGAQPRAGASSTAPAAEAGSLP